MTISKSDVIGLIMGGVETGDYTTPEWMDHFTRILISSEPRWHGALVEDRDGDLWVNRGGTSVWRCPDSDGQFDWTDLNLKYGPMKVLFEGVKDE